MKKPGARGDAIGMYVALKRIAHYDSIAYLRKSSEKAYGLEYLEALEMSYENIIEEAQQGLRGVRDPRKLAANKEAVS